MPPKFTPQGAADGGINRDVVDEGPESGGQTRGQHLLRHRLPSMDIELHFCSSRKKDIVKEVKCMKQKDLQVRGRTLCGIRSVNGPVYD